MILVLNGGRGGGEEGRGGKETERERDHERNRDEVNQIWQMLTTI